jgi:hypothetical protein
VSEVYRYREERMMLGKVVSLKLQLTRVFDDLVLVGRSSLMIKNVERI